MPVIIMPRCGRKVLLRDTQWGLLVKQNRILLLNPAEFCFMNLVDLAGSWSPLWPISDLPPNGLSELRHSNVMQLRTDRTPCLSTLSAKSASWTGADRAGARPVRVTLRLYTSGFWKIRVLLKDLKNVRSKHVTDSTPWRWTQYASLNTAARYTVLYPRRL